MQPLVPKRWLFPSFAGRLAGQDVFVSDDAANKVSFLDCEEDPVFCEVRNISWVQHAQAMQDGRSIQN